MELVSKLLPENAAWHARSNFLQEHVTPTSDSILSGNRSVLAALFFSYLLACHVLRRNFPTLPYFSFYLPFAFGRHCFATVLFRCFFEKFPFRLGF